MIVYHPIPHCVLSHYDKRIALQQLKLNIEMHEVLFEFIRQGKYVKVSAIDLETLTEATIIGDVRQNRSFLKSIAIKKLRYIINKPKMKERTQAR